MLANTVVGGTQEDPGVVGFLWVRTPDVVDLVLHRTKTEESEQPDFDEPDPEIVGFAPLTYATALTYEKGQGRPVRTASYALSDGAFLYSDIEGNGRKYVFADANPEDDDKAIAIIFRLQKSKRAAG